MREEEREGKKGRKRAREREGCILIVLLYKKYKRTIRYWLMYLFFSFF